VTYRTHMAFGAASAAVLVGPVHDMLGGPPLPHPAITVPAALLLGSLAGLAPDLDEPNAALARGSWTPQTAPKLFRLSRFAIFLAVFPSAWFTVARCFRASRRHPFPFVCNLRDAACRKHGQHLPRAAIRLGYAVFPIRISFAHLCG